MPTDADLAALRDQIAALRAALDALTRRMTDEQVALAARVAHLETQALLLAHMAKERDRERDEDDGSDSH